MGLGAVLMENATPEAHVPPLHCDVLKRMPEIVRVWSSCVSGEMGSKQQLWKSEQASAPQAPRAASQGQTLQSDRQKCWCPCCQLLPVQDTIPSEPTAIPACDGQMVTAGPGTVAGRPEVLLWRAPALSGNSVQGSRRVRFTPRRPQCLSWHPQSHPT